MLLKQNETIVFAGDSVTDAGKNGPFGIANALGQDLGEGYVRFFSDILSATYPELNIQIVNSGISGNTSQALRDRWETDVLSFKPEWLSICIGINDSIGKFLYPKHLEQTESYQRYTDNLEYMVKTAQESGTKVILVSPYTAEPWSDDPLRKDMDEFRSICKKTAEKFSCTYVDIQEMFDRYFKIRHQCCIAWDRVHPNRIGAYMIARELLKVFEFDYLHTGSETDE